MRKKYDNKDFFIVADSKNDSVSKFSLLTKEYFDKNKITKPNDLTLGNSGKGTEFVIGKNGNKIQSLKLKNQKRKLKSSTHKKRSLSCKLKKKSTTSCALFCRTTELNP